MDELLFSIASGYTKTASAQTKDTTAFCDAVKFYTLATASVLCEKEKML